MDRCAVTIALCLVLAATSTGGQLHLTSMPTRPPVGGEFSVAVWAQDFPPVAAVDLRFALDSLAVRVVGVTPMVLSRFEWLRWKLEVSHTPTLTALMLTSPSSAVSFADGDTLAVLHCIRLSAEPTVIGLRTGCPLAIDASNKEVPCTLFPAALSQVTAVHLAEEQQAIALMADVRPNPGHQRLSMVVHSPRGENQAKLLLYDVGGRLVWERTFVFPAGTSHLHWDGVDAHGQQVPAGTYFYRLRTSTQEVKGKCVLLR